MRCDSLKELASVSTDVTFAQEFISRDGHLLLVKTVEDSKELVSSVDGYILQEEVFDLHLLQTLFQLRLKPVYLAVSMIIDNTQTSL